MSSISSSVVSVAWEHEDAESNRAGSNYNDSSNAVHATHQQSPLSELKLRVHTLRDEVERSAALHHKANLTCANHRRELNMLQEKERALYTVNEDRLKMEVERVLEMNKILRERLERQKKEEKEALQRTLETTRTESRARTDALQETLNALQETWQEVKLQSEHVEEMKSSVERELSNDVHTRSQLEHDMKLLQSKVQSYTDEHSVRLSEPVGTKEEVEANYTKANVNFTNNVNNPLLAKNYCINNEENNANILLSETKKLEEKDMVRRLKDKNHTSSSIHFAALPVHASTTADASVDKMMRSAHIKHDAVRQLSANLENKFPCYEHQISSSSSSSSSAYTASLSSSSSSSSSSSCSLEEHELNATPFMYKHLGPVQAVFVPAGMTDSERATLPASHHIASLVSTIKRHNTYLPHSFYARHHIDLHLCQSPFRDRINEIRENAATREGNIMLSNGKCALPLLEVPTNFTDILNAFIENKVHDSTLSGSDDHNNCNLGKSRNCEDEKWKLLASLHSSQQQQQNQQQQNGEEEPESVMHKNMTRELEHNFTDVYHEEQECNNNNNSNVDNTKCQSNDREMEYYMKTNKANEIYRKHRNNCKHRKQKNGNVQESLDKVCKTLLYELSCLQCEYAECELKLSRRRERGKNNNDNSNTHDPMKNDHDDNNVMLISKHMRQTLKTIERKIAQLQTLRQLERKLHHTVNIYNTLRSVVKENHYCDEIYNSVLELLRCG